MTQNKKSSMQAELCRRLAPHKLLSPNTLSVEVCGEEAGDQAAINIPRASSPLSPVRGISYPPLSPKSLKRGFAIQTPPRNPPLVKSRHTEVAPPPPLPPNITVIPDQCPAPAPAPAPSHAQPEPSPAPDTEQEQRMKRGGRFERPADSRRYHTAGTIEDLKVGPE